MRKFFLVILALSSSTFDLNAVSLDQARSQGLVCEGTDGLLTSVGSPSGEIQSFISTINAQRNQEYAKIQQSQPGTTLEQVKSIAAQEIIYSVPPGTYIMNAQGNCTPK
ncbi:MAG: YdbL family protein [Proteobacteria bacterium]|nr:YdbL family protein [Pseudomonadota bacterium]